MFFGFGEPTWFQNGGKLGPQNASMSETLKRKKSPLAAARARFFMIFAMQVAAKNDQKSQKRMSGAWEGIWASILIDFGGFREPSREPKWNNNLSKKASKTEAILECVLGSLWARLEL